MHTQTFLSVLERRFHSQTPPIHQYPLAPMHTLRGFANYHCHRSAIGNHVAGAIRTRGSAHGPCLEPSTRCVNGMYRDQPARLPSKRWVSRSRPRWSRRWSRSRRKPEPESKAAQVYEIHATWLAGYQDPSGAGWWARTGEQTQSGGGNRMHIVVAPLVRPAARQEAGARRGDDGGVAVRGE